MILFRIGAAISIRIVCKHEAPFDWVLWNQIQINYNGQSKERKIPLRANENSKYKQFNFLKRGKTRLTKSWLVWVLHLIGLESGTNFLEQSRSEVKKNPYNSRLSRITLDPIALLDEVERNIVICQQQVVQSDNVQ